MKYFTYKYLNNNVQKLKLFKNKLKIGTSTFSISNDFLTINNIFIHNQFRRHGYGSFILNHIEDLSMNHNEDLSMNHNEDLSMNHNEDLSMNRIEDLSINNYKIEKINLLAWQPSGSTNVLDFFERNNYTLNNENGIKLYDDYDTIYELHNFEKNISFRKI